MRGNNMYFSETFEVEREMIKQYGALDISLMTDLPLFIDPFLIFNSKKQQYKQLHKQIIDYVVFLRDMSISQLINKLQLKKFYCFPEVKQTWLGYSEFGNSGRGPGLVFAKSLNENLAGIFKDFDKNDISNSSHLEKLCLIKNNIGRDNISDFVTNLIKNYLFKYTEVFSKQNINKKYLRNFAIRRANFNFGEKQWENANFTLPNLNGDYVLLTPTDILTKDDTWINKNDLIIDFTAILDSIPNEEMRDELSRYFVANLPKPNKNKNGTDKEPNKTEMSHAVNAVINKYPSILDYYIKYKEEDGQSAVKLSDNYVKEVVSLFIDQLEPAVTQLVKEGFYNKHYNTLAEAYERTIFFKKFIEDNDGYRILYYNNMPIKKEIYIQLLYKLVWFGAKSDVSREVNNGRGSVDYKISRGSTDKTLVEFKLASNTKLKANLANQVEIYKKANDTNNSIKVIFYFSQEEKQKVHDILSELGLSQEKYIVLFDACKDTKLSASNVK
jgi:hypothetical protein